MPSVRHYDESVASNPAWNLLVIVEQGSGGDRGGPSVRVHQVRRLLSGHFQIGKNQRRPATPTVLVFGSRRAHPCVLPSALVQFGSVRTGEHGGVFNFK